MFEQTRKMWQWLWELTGEGEKMEREAPEATVAKAHRNRPLWWRQGNRTRKDRLIDWMLDSFYILAVVSTSLVCVSAIATIIWLAGPAFGWW